MGGCGVSHPVRALGPVRRCYGDATKRGSPGAAAGGACGLHQSTWIVQGTAGNAAIDTTFLGTAAPSPPWRRWRLVELSATERAATLYPSSLSYLLIL